MTETPAPRGTRTQADSKRWRVVQEVLHEALTRPAERRDQFLERACHGDSGLRDEVRSLLEAHDGVGTLDRLAVEVMGPLVGPLRAGPDRIPGHFEVLEEVGRGGMGVVYRARDLRLEREVALKVLPPGPKLTVDSRARFVREARAAGRLDHPNICTVHEIGETGDGGLFIAMPFYGGRTLKDTVAGGALRWTAALDLGVQIARGLGAAHQAGIVHRDIKPANVCITSTGAVKIVDFGIAKVGDNTATAAEPTRGTAAYMSPEQVRGQQVDQRTDLWSLGAVLYELLTATRLFPADEVGELLAAIRSTEPVDLGSLAGAVPLALYRLLEQLLARDPAERPSSAALVARGLEEVPGLAEKSAESGWHRAPYLAAEGERRQATMLELRIGRHSSPRARLDTDELEGRLTAIRNSVEDVAWRHGGVLNEVSGERMVMVFGIPVTHEDDVRRALLAATDLHEMPELAGQLPSEVSLDIQVGVARGIVVARPERPGSRGLRLEGSPLGLASRLASAAPPGETWLDAESARGAGSAFTLGRAGVVSGASGQPPLEAVRVRGVQEGTAHRPAARWSRLTPYTGRDIETDTLVSGFERARTGFGQVVIVAGEAGSGKSRLVLEFRRRAEARLARVVQGGCPSHPATRPYQPFVEVLFEILGLNPRNVGAEAERRIVNAVRRLDADLESFLPWYLHLLAVPSERFPPPAEIHGEPFRAAMREALVALLTFVSREAPLVLLLEDWQWVDEASQEVLGQLAELVGTLPLFVVVTMRPGYGSDLEKAGRHTVIHLEALGPAESAEMVRSILGAEEVPVEVATAIQERAGGNPFFLEELCQSLQEAGMLRVESGRASLLETPERLHLPSTIQGTVRARLDRLRSETRDIVRAAAVLGRTFDYALLQMLAPDHHALSRSLRRLVELGILQQSQVVPEPRYRFKHVLTQEVAYDTLLEHQRVALHRRTGQAIETLFPDRVAENMPLLAHHFSRAEEWLKAVRYGRAAAERTRDLNEFADVLHQLEAVDRWLSRLPADDQRRELEVDTLLRQEEMCEPLGLRGRQHELLDRVKELLDEETDHRRLAEVYRRRGDVYTLLRRFDEARAALATALGQVRETDDRTLEANVLRSFGLTDWHQGRFDDALRRIDQAIRLDRELGDTTCLITDLNNKGHILKDLKAYESALQVFEEGLALLDEAPSDVQRYYTVHNISNLYRDQGDHDRAREYLDIAGELTRVANLPVQRGVYLNSVANFHLQCGETDAAVAAYEEAVAVGRRARYAEGLAHSALPLGELLATLGRPAEALLYLREAANLFERLGNSEVEATVWRQVADVAFRLGDLPATEDAWRHCEEIARDLAEDEMLIDALEGTGRARRELGGELSRAREPLEEALTRARAAGDRRREGRVLNGLGILEWRCGEYVRALTRYEAALALYRDLDDPAHVGMTLNSLGVTLRALGRRDAARSRLNEALAIHRRTGERLLEGHAMAALGDLSQDGGDLELAQEWFARSLEVRRTIGDRSGEGWMQQRLARVHFAAERQQAARTCLDAARQIAAEVSDDELLLACDEVLV